MFYNNSNDTFKILGIFLINRSKNEGIASNRTHAALSYRIVGDSTFFVGQKKLIAKSGSIVYIPKGVSYRHINMEEKVIIIHLDHWGSSKETIEIINNAKEFEALFQNLLSVWEEKRTDMYNRSMATLYRLFSQLQKTYDPVTSNVPQIIMPGLQLIQKNFKDPNLTISQLASKCCVSEVFFRKLYRSHFNESPLQTILKLRFDYAGTLLLSGYYTQKQVAELSGFSDVKYFRKAFKKYYGITPSQFMQSQK